ncbi:MAG: hypothetical protein EOO61_10490 [Hymenobacter sp.]|nr:MAG: hypothetical protein EOO61_10490 [Hymenobacter sp.]
MNSIRVFQMDFSPQLTKEDTDQWMRDSMDWLTGHISDSIFHACPEAKYAFRYELEPHTCYSYLIYADFEQEQDAILYRLRK